MSSIDNWQSMPESRDMTRLLYRLGRFSVRRRRLVVLTWLVAAVGVLVVGQAAGGELSDEFEVPSLEAQKAFDVLEERFPAAAGTSAQLVFTADDGGSLTTPAASTAVASALADVADQPHVEDVGELQLSDGDLVGLVDVQYDAPVADIREDAFGRLEA